MRPFNAVPGPRVIEVAVEAALVTPEHHDLAALGVVGHARGVPNRWHRGGMLLRPSRAVPSPRVVQFGSVAPPPEQDHFASLGVISQPDVGPGTGRGGREPLRPDRPVPHPRVVEIVT